METDDAFEELIAQIQSARQHERNGEALELCRAAYAQRPDDSRVQDHLMALLVEGAGYAEAIALFEKHHPVEGRTDGDRMRLAGMYLDAGDNGPAVQLFQEFDAALRGEVPSNAYLPVLYVRFLYLNGQFQEVMRVVQNIKMEWMIPSIRLDLLQTALSACLVLDDVAYASELVQRIQTVDPYGKDSCAAQVALYRHRLEWHEVIRITTAWLEHSPISDWARFELGQAFYNLGEYKAAKEAIWPIVQHVTGRSLGVPCLLLANIPAVYFEVGEPGPEHFVHVYLRSPGAANDHTLVANALELAEKKGLDLAWHAIRRCLPFMNLAADPHAARVMANVRPFLALLEGGHAATASTERSCMILAAFFYLGGAGLAFQVVHTIAALEQIRSSRILDHFHAALCDSMLVDRGDEWEAESLRLAQVACADGTTDLDELYYSIRRRLRKGQEDEIRTLLLDLRGQGRWSVPLHFLHIELQSQGDLTDYMATEPGQHSLADLVEHIEHSPTSFFRAPRPIWVPTKMGPKDLRALVPLFQLMDHLELMTHVRAYVQQFQKDRIWDDLYNSRGDLFASLLRFEAYEALRDRSFLDPGSDTLTHTAVSWLAEQLTVGHVVGDIEQRARSYAGAAPLDILCAIGDMVFAAVVASRSHAEGLPRERALRTMRESYLVCAVLQREGALSLDDLLIIRHYTEYALLELVRMDTKAVSSAVKGHVDGNLLDLLHTFHEVGELLERTIATLKPVQFLCASMVSSMTQHLSKRFIAEDFLSFEDFRKQVRERSPQT